MSLKKLMTFISAVAVLALLSQPASEPNADNWLATTNAIAVNASGDNTAPSPDFDGDSRVGFSDFLILAEHFGTRQGDGQYDSRIDLDSDGAIGFSDFLLFAEAFGTVVETPSGFAPADQDAFDRLAVGKRILLETFFLDVVSAGRFTEGFRRHGGRYAYTKAGANTAQFTQTYDDPELFGGRCTTRLTFTSPTTGAGRFACDNGATGETENWSLSDLTTPMFLGAAPDTLYFAFRDTWRAGQTRAYDLQLKEKTPQGRWNDVCVTYSNRSDNTITAYARPWIYSPALAPNTTYEFRYRYRNSSSCNTGSPGPWSPIVEGATPGSGTGGGGGGGGGGGRPDLVVDAPTVSNSSPTAGASFTLSATVRNQGTGQSAATTLRWYLSADATISASDTEVGSRVVGGLAASPHQFRVDHPDRPLERRDLLLRRLRRERQRRNRYREQLLPGRDRNRGRPGSRRRCPCGQQQQADRRGFLHPERHGTQPGLGQLRRRPPCATTYPPTRRLRPGIRRSAPTRWASLPLPVPVPSRSA